MDKKTAGLLGAVAGLATMGSAHAGFPDASEALKASSYADLLKPIPNAKEVLAADDASRSNVQALMVAQFYFGYGYQAPYYYNAPAYPYYSYTSPGYYYAPRPYYYHHHHHHHYWGYR
jgi:hypothetical protein